MARYKEPTPEQLKSQASAAAPFLKSFANGEINRVLNAWLDPFEDPGHATAIGVRAELRAIRELCRTYGANVDVGEAGLGEDNP